MSVRRDPPLMHGMNGRVDEYGQDPNIAAQQAAQVTVSASYSSYHHAYLPQECFLQANLPPSIVEALENGGYPAPHVADLHGATLMDYPLHEDMDKLKTSPDLSFSGRMLQLQQNPGQRAKIAVPDDSYLFDPYSNDVNSMADDFLSVPPSNNSSSFSVSNVSDMSGQDAYYAYPGDSLDYHTIGFNAAAAIENMSMKARIITPQSSQSSQTDSMTDVKQIRSCPFCTDKQYTGTCAQRNLARHLETKHSASPDGVKKVPCTYPGCQSLFNRGDARLVHVRRIHPDSNIPRAKKRKRNEDE